VTAPTALSTAVEDGQLPAAALRLTTGVTVLTVRHLDRMHGSTTSAVSLVSREPLTVGSGLRQDSELSRLARESGWFAVNVLSGRQSLLADWFARPERPRDRAQFELLDWEEEPEHGLPLLRNAVAHLVCQVAGRVPVGDHDLLLGTVVRGRTGPGSPLISYAGALHGAEFADVRRRRGPAAQAAALD
jgi:flavin reductase (DIM6/NTAB) family NADH-FMN oxidoreductase RutF